MTFSIASNMAAEIVRSLFGSWTEYLAAAGGLAVSYIAFKVALAVINIIKTYVLGKYLSEAALARFEGQWAVITGATDGIGKEYARQLASLGINIVLISRTESKLQAVAKEIEAESKVQTRIIAADFSKGTSIYENIRSKLDGLIVGILVNNVGLSYDYPEFFLDVPDRDNLFMNLINVNCTSATLMSSLVMPGMVARKKGVVINIASAAGNVPTPLLTVYSACKVYVQYLSQCLSLEYSRHGIIIQSVNPYFVCSNMSKIKRPSKFIPSARAYVKSALSTVGLENMTSGYLPHHLTKMGTELLPGSVIRKIGFDQLLSARARALKKLAAKQE